jgi:hypothetical protein
VTPAGSFLAVQWQHVLAEGSPISISPGREPEAAPAPSAYSPSPAANDTIDASINHSTGAMSSV